MKKEDKEKDNNKSDNTSSFSNTRSSKFDDLTSNTSRPNNPGTKGPIDKKSLAKKIWKWITICIYLFLAGLGITGFIQSCVLKTSSTVGSGVEFYRNSSEIAPYVSNFKIVEKEVEVYEYDNDGKLIRDNSGNPKTKKIKTYVIEAFTKENYLTDVATIKKIKKQLEADYGKEVANLYGSYGNYSSALRIIGIDGYALTSSEDIKGKKDSDTELMSGEKPSTTYIDTDEQADNSSSSFIFLNNKILDYLNENGKSYKIKNQLYDLSIFVSKRPNDNEWNKLSNSQKNAYGSPLSSIENCFSVYEPTMTNGTPDYNKLIKVKNIGDSYYTNDVNADGIPDTSEDVQILDKERIDRFRYTLDAELATLSSSEKGLFNSEKFARDYFQSMANINLKFIQLQDFYTLLSKKAGVQINDLNSTDDVLKAVSKENLNKLINTSITYNNNGIDQRALNMSNTYSLKEKNAIITYQNEMLKLMANFGYGIRYQNYTDEDSTHYVPNKKDFEIEFMPDKNDKRNILIGTPSIIQKPITSWADSWRLGPFYGLIVYPLSAIINSMMGSMEYMAGWDAILAIIIAILITRVIVTLFTYKSLFATHKQQQLNPKKAKIDEKYQGFKGNREMEQRKRQEIAKLYKSNNVSMTAPLKAMCISMPIFFAVWRVIQGIVDIKSTTWLGIQFSLTSWKELFNGAWQYFPLLLFAAGVQIISHLLPRILNRKRMKERTNRAEQKALKKSNKTQTIVMIVFVVMSVLFEAGVQIYWIISGLWQIMQVLVVHKIVKTQWFKEKGYKYV